MHSPKIVVATPTPLPAAASDQEALAALRQAREVFGRGLSSWACDMLEVRRLGLDQARWASPDAGAARLRRAA